MRRRRLVDHVCGPPSRVCQLFMWPRGYDESPVSRVIDTQSRSRCRMRFLGLWLFGWGGLRRLDLVGVLNDLVGLTGSLSPRPRRHAGDFRRYAVVFSCNGRHPLSCFRLRGVLWAHTCWRWVEPFASALTSRRRLTWTPRSPRVDMRPSARALLGLRRGSIPSFHHLGRSFGQGIHDGLVFLLGSRDTVPERLACFGDLLCHGLVGLWLGGNVLGRRVGLRGRI